MIWIIPLAVVVVVLGATAFARARREPSRRLARGIRKRFLDVRIREDDGRLYASREGRDVIIPLARVRAGERLGETRLEAEIAHSLAELDRALRWTSLADWGDPKSIDDIVPVPLPTERTEVLGPNRRFTVRIGDGVEVGFVVHGPSSGRWVTVGDRDEWDLKGRELLGTGLRNLREKTDGVVILQEDRPGREVYIVRQGDGLDSSRLLLRELWDRVAEVCGGELVICAPTRDRVYAAPLHQPESIERLVRHVAEDWANKPHGVSPKIWVWNEGRLEPWTMHA